MKNGDKATAKIDSDAALIAAIVQSMNTGLELHKEFQDNPSFKKWIQESVFNKTCNNQ
jgi:type I restriction enzyme R subunit